MSPEARRRRRRESVFHERRIYRHRRGRDAARLLSVLGAILFALPLLWERAGADGAVAMSTAVIYLFTAWAGLVLASFWVGFGARHWEQDGDTAPEDGEDGA
ncbi:hypothetical protein [Pontibaca methylaminivorans]|uniref:hypothetical protein n=1 Tax=Pontibaca methylaminivorans TaxID=515897 RepID=UPI002FD9D673